MPEPLPKYYVRDIDGTYHEEDNAVVVRLVNRIESLKRLLARARPHVDAPLGTLAADIDLELNR